MNPVYDRLIALLCRHISKINAQSILGRAMREVGIRQAEIKSDHLPQLAARLEPSLKLFLRPAAFATVQTDLKRMCGPIEAPKLEVVKIRNEPDIADARGMVRKMAQRLGVRTIVAQRIATIVSELARNIYMYAGEGSVELHPETAPKPRVRVVALDSGPGIDNLDEVMSGVYRSRTGLGEGIRGTKKLADRFDIKTGATGTRIEAEVHL